MSAAAPAPPHYTNVTLMKAMQAKKYDPMPTDQHQWQRAEGEPMVHRIWSVLCACSIRARLIGNRLVTTPYATDDDGVAPLTLVGITALLGETEGGNVRRAWRLGEEAGIWRREGGKLWLNGSVRAVQISEAKKQRKKVCTDLLTKADLLKIKGWPKEQREEFQALWNDVHDYEKARIAEATCRERDICAPVKDTIKTRFGLEVRHIEQTGRRAAVVPPRLLEFVQTGVHSRKNGAVQTGASLLPTENPQRTRTPPPTGSSTSAEDRKKVAANAAIPTPDKAAETPRRPTPEPSHMGELQSRDHTNLLANMASEFSITEHTAGQLLDQAREIEPSITVRETKHLAKQMLLNDPHGIRRPVGLLLAKLHTRASGITLEAAREAARREIDHDIREAQQMLRFTADDVPPEVNLTEMQQRARETIARLTAELAATQKSKGAAS